MAVQLQGRDSNDKLNNVFVDSNHRLHTAASFISSKTTLVTANKLLEPGNTTESIDITGSESIRIYGTSSVGKNIDIEYGNTNNNWINCDKLLTLTNGSSHTFNKLISAPPSYIRLKNNHSSNITLTIHVVKSS